MVEPISDEALALYRGSSGSEVAGDDLQRILSRLDAVEKNNKELRQRLRVTTPSHLLYAYVLELEHALEEANLEIARHHKDFKKIKDILDCPFHSSTLNAVKKIRNVVG